MVVPVSLVESAEVKLKTYGLVGGQVFTAPIASPEQEIKKAPESSREPFLLVIHPQLAEDFFHVFEALCVGFSVELDERLRNTGKDSL